MGELKNRKRVNLILSQETVEWLTYENSQTDVPMSRIVERAIHKEYKEKIDEYFKSKKKEG